MTEEQKREVAVFRFGVISDFCGQRKLDFGERERLIRVKCAQKWLIPHSDKTSISRGTLRRWIQKYLDSGKKLEALYPKDREDRGASRIIDAEVAQAIIRLRTEMPRSPVTEILKTMRDRQVITADMSIGYTTVCRFLRAHGLMRLECVETAVDRRKFEAELPNDIWQADCMHGPKLMVAAIRRKSYLIAFIDDHSRLIPHAEFYPTEGVSAFMNAFEQAMLKRGIPRKLYVDNGSAFRSRQLQHTAASLGCALVHARPYQPQGKGKIERFFKTIRTGFLPNFRGESLEEINEALTLWLANVYHLRRHSSTNASPLERFAAGVECLRVAPDNLKDSFRTILRRRVNRDRSVIIDRRLFEAPVALVGKQVELLYHADLADTIEVRWNGKSYGFLQPLDLLLNSRIRRESATPHPAKQRTDSPDKQEAQEFAPESGQLWG